MSPQAEKWVKKHYKCPFGNPDEKSRLRHVLFKYIIFSDLKYLFIEVKPFFSINVSIGQDTLLSVFINLDTIS
jgi:hypothetical protein